MKISTKILLPLLTTLTIGFCLSISLTYNMGNTALTDASVRSQKMLIDYTLYELEKKLEFDVLNAISLAQTELLQPYFSGTLAEQAMSAGMAQNRIINMRNTYSYVMLGLLNTEGVAVRHTEKGFVGKSFADQSFFREAMEGKTVAGTPFHYKGMVLYPVASPVLHTQTEEIIGVVFNVSRLGKTAYESEHLGKKGYVMVADSNGLVFIHKDDNYVLKYNMKETSWGRTMLETREGNIDFEIGGNQKNASYSTMESTGWAVVAVVNIAELVEPSAVILRNGLILNIIILICLTFIIYISVNPIIKNLLKAIKYSESIARGNLDEELDLYQQDEVGDLSNALRYMVNTLKEKIAEATTQKQLAIQKSKELSIALKATKDAMLEATTQKQLAIQKSEEALIALAVAESATKAKSQFLATMSHEIRTPINSILGLSDLLSSGNLEGQNLAHVVTINQSSALLLKIINDILDLSKLEAGKLELTPINYRLSESIDHVSSLASALASVKKLQYELVTRGDMDACLHGDDIRLRQVLINLLSNSIKFTSTGMVSLIIAVQENSLQFIVKDNGIGIKQEDLASIFDPFRQLDKLKNRNQQGTGLGLTICHDLITLMDGTITVESVHGEGATFTLTIPKILGDVTQLAQKNIEQTPFTTKDVHVLVVDDMDINLYVAKALLESYNVKITTAKSGEEALQHVQDTDFDFVFMDYYMPKMDGLETTIAIRKLDPRFANLPIIALTANAMAEDKVKCREATMDDFLSKPIERKKLYSILERWIPAAKRIY